MPVRIDTIEGMSEEEFNQLQRAKTGRTLDPAMEELLNRLEAGEIVRVSVAPDQSVRGLRVAISRRASQRGMSIESVEGEGFLAVRRSLDAISRPSRQSQSGNGRRRGRKPRLESRETTGDGETGPTEV